MRTGRQVFTAEFRKTDDHPNGSALGTLTLYVDTRPVGEAKIMTQPGTFSLVGDGLCVGRDSGSPISREDYLPPFRFTGAIDRVVVDVGGEPFHDHEKELQAWLTRD